ncbi:hypothetical protein Bca4012_071097 [Brassica carinata]
MTTDTMSSSRRFRFVDRVFGTSKLGGSVEGLVYVLLGLRDMTTTHESSFNTLIMHFENLHFTFDYGDRVVRLKRLFFFIVQFEISCTLNV